MKAERKHYRRLSERLRLYQEAKNLQQQGLSQRKISRLLKLPRSQVGAWLSKGVPPHYDRYQPDLRPSPDLAYLIGFWLGDGRDAGGQKKVRFKLANKEQIEYVNLLIARLLSREPKRILRDGTFYVVDYDTAVLYD